MSKQSFKEYLGEYYKYFNSFSEVIDHHDVDENKDKGHELEKAEDDDFASDGEKVKMKTKKRGIRKSPYHRDSEDLNPRRFRQWMELSIAGD